VSRLAIRGESRDSYQGMPSGMPKAPQNQGAFRRRVAAFDFYHGLPGINRLSTEGHRTGQVKAAARMKSCVCALLLIAACIGSAGCKHGSVTEAAFFPAANEVAGWAKTSATRTFAAADLWKYIDGGAEKYLKAGVQSASTSDYKFQDKLEAVADIYSMASADGAREILESEPAGDAKTPPLGDSARLHRQSLVFRQGPRVVQIVAYQEFPEAQQALLDLGRGIEKRLPR